MVSLTPTPPPPKRSGFWGRLRGNFFAGLIIVLPVGLTIYFIVAFVGFVDQRVLPLLPDRFNPMTYIDVNIPGLGVIVFLVFTTLIGSITKGLFGRQLLRWVEGIVDRTPVVRSIYNALKQIMETVFNNQNTSFEKACLIQYPREGIWAVGFVSTSTKGEVLIRSGEEEMLSVFVPTTPNPTSGFLLFFPKRDVILLDMEVEDAAKLIISAGLVTPPTDLEAEPKDSAPKSEPLVLTDKQQT
ncbi:MAG: DUF502 domain-containing protein [Pseudomonadota bacterium]